MASDLSYVALQCLPRCGVSSCVGYGDGGAASFMAHMERAMKDLALTSPIDEDRYIVTPSE